MLSLKFSEILKQNNLLRHQSTGKEYRLRILSNITTNPLSDLLSHLMLKEGIRPEISIGNYDNIVQDSANCSDQDAVVVLYDTWGFTTDLPLFIEAAGEELYNALLNRVCSEIDIILENLKESPSILFNRFSDGSFVSGFSHPSLREKLVQQLNLYLESKSQRNLTLLNIEKILQLTGLTAAIDSRFFYSSRAPYTISFLKHYAQALMPVIRKNTGKLKKALIFDCDNTLWGGILGEDGVEGIQMGTESPIGEIFRSIQQIASWLSQNGVIIGICSKNNPEDVQALFENETGKTFLKISDIVISKVNWNDKATNLRTIATELNIGLDSLVFVDDSSFEINLVNTELPEVLTLQVPVNLSDYPRQLLSAIYQYFNIATTEEDREKTKLYKTQILRQDAKKTAVNLDQYLASLHITLTINENDPAHIGRIAQLTQKTNQFNLTTKRYTESQIEHFMQTGTILSVSVKDDFGDNGITALAILTHPEAGEMEIDTLLMSCRVIGRNIEYAFMDHLMNIATKQNIKSIRASYLPTAKNNQVASLFDQLGFSIESSSPEGIIHYRMNSEEYQPFGINYITITA